MKICYWNIFKISYKLKQSLHKKCLKKLCSLIWSTAQWFTETKRRIWENWVSSVQIILYLGPAAPWHSCKSWQYHHNPTIPQSQSLVLSCIIPAGHSYWLPMRVWGWTELHHHNKPNQISTNQHSPREHQLTEGRRILHICWITQSMKVL